jgi:hypothetical protein
MVGVMIEIEFTGFISHIEIHESAGLENVGKQHVLHAFLVNDAVVDQTGKIVIFAQCQRT